jgi:hypothetical protein
VLKRAAFAVVGVVAACAYAPSQQAQQTPSVETQKESTNTPNNKKNPDRSPPTLVSKPADASHSADGHKDGNQEGTEFWPPFLGVRLKITDSLIALFTGVLAIYTARLNKSTKKLWGEANIASGLAKESIDLARQEFNSTASAQAHSALRISDGYDSSSGRQDKNALRGR